MFSWTLVVRTHAAPLGKEGFLVLLDQVKASAALSPKYQKLDLTQIPPTSLVVLKPDLSSDLPPATSKKFLNI